MKTLIILILAIPIGFMAFDTVINGDQAPEYRVIGTILFTVASWLAYQVNREARLNKNTNSVINN